MPVPFELGDVLQLKKPHACGANRWKVIRLGMDIRVKCEECGHSVLIPRARFERLTRKVLMPASQGMQSVMENQQD
ncbi:DUF951 domain-containing protein [Alicyclobacillus cycloheptanicus]|uniref:DUF951 domain-containing protein n=1 Tax=Alicyclobacillus cycloheptanicus TaxID=1457 RepID=A0ABT9XMI7_9BACL|nr:DUF951 domain-containing protein [Alicyclobacillus cycloheptanicus]MDQ0190938.1 hypothetical protein [Alicyclobacillus cycloheptanicus]WDM02387.1 DUF951 domain-containing protein [Alicyclobacillus cycloheptanicus]